MSFGSELLIFKCGKICIGQAVYQKAFPEMTGGILLVAVPCVVLNSGAEF